MISPYCPAVHEEGWRCILLRGHTGQCLSLDYRGLWHGTAGFPIWWWGPGAPGSVLEHPDPPPAPKVVPAPADVSQPRPAVRKLVETGDLCSECGEFAMVRRGTCLTCQACGNTSGGCA